MWYWKEPLQVPTLPDSAFWKHQGPHENLGPQCHPFPTPGKDQVSETKKNPYYFPLNPGWFNRDPDIRLMKESPYHWVGFHPHIQPKQPGAFFFHCSGIFKASASVKGSWWWMYSVKKGLKNFGVSWRFSGGCQLDFYEWNEGVLGCPRKLGSMVCKWVISPTKKWDILGLVTTYWSQTIY